jgi:hypothetical protein
MLTQDFIKKVQATIHKTVTLNKLCGLFIVITNKKKLSYVSCLAWEAAIHIFLTNWIPSTQFSEQLIIIPVSSMT